MLFPRDDAHHPLACSFRDFIQNPAFPCVGAKSALSRGQIRIVVARDLTSGWDDLRIYPALLAFVSRYRREPGLFCSFAVIFEGPTALSEAAFERHLWARLQSFSDKDAWLGLPYDARVQAHPDDPHFAPSLGARASSWWACTRTPAARRAGPRRRRWCSTCTTSSRGCGRRGATGGCASASLRATWPTRARSTRCWRRMARPRR